VGQFQDDDLKRWRQMTFERCMVLVESSASLANPKRLKNEKGATLSPR